MNKTKGNDCLKCAIGNNIRQLRRRAGMTIKELAAEVDIQPEPMGNIERGVNAPSARILHALAGTLQVSADALFAENSDMLRQRCEAVSTTPFPVAPEERSLGSATVKFGDRLCVDCLALEDLCSAQKHAAIPLRVNFESNEAGMDQLARLVRHYMDIRYGIVFDYFELFEDCGFRVLLMPLPDEVDSFSYFDPANENAFFFIDSNRNSEKQLFSLAFELGMIYLRATPRPVQDKGDQVLRLARKFAAFFLMPSESVLRTVYQLGVDSNHWTYDLLLRIKHRFGVSAESFLYRLRELACISESRYAEIKATIYRHYEATGFAEPDSSRRIPTPNGRLWDLVMVARAIPEAAEEAAEIERRLGAAQIPREPNYKLVY